MSKQSNFVLSSDKFFRGEINFSFYGHKRKLANMLYAYA